MLSAFNIPRYLKFSSAPTVPILSRFGSSIHSIVSLLLLFNISRTFFQCQILFLYSGCVFLWFRSGFLFFFYGKYLDIINTRGVLCLSVFLYFCGTLCIMTKWHRRYNKIAVVRLSLLKMPLWIFTSANVCPHVFNSTFQLSMTFVVMFILRWIFCTFPYILLSKFPAPHKGLFCNNSMPRLHFSAMF